MSLNYCHSLTAQYLTHLTIADGMDVPVEHIVIRTDGQRAQFVIGLRKHWDLDGMPQRETRTYIVVCDGASWNVH